MQNIVILGAGFGGLTAALILDSLAATNEAKVSLIDRNSSFGMGFSMQWVLMRRRNAEEGVRSYGSLAAKHVDFIRDEITNIDVSSRIVLTKAHALNYDHLILALGAELSPELIPGLGDAAYNLCELNSVLQLRQSVERINSGTVLIGVSSVPFKCPPAPYEYAMLIDDKLRQRKIRDSVRIVVSSPEPQPMPVAGKAVGEAVKELLSERGIEYLPVHKIKAVDPKMRRVSYETGEILDYSILAAMPPHRAPKVVRESGLADPSGFVPANLTTFETAAPGVYAIGDVASLKLPNGSHHPKSGAFAEAQATAVARNLTARIRGGKESVKYSGVGACFVDVGGDQAAQGTAELLTPEGVKFAFVPPSTEGMAAKSAFESERLRAWFNS